ncbi:MULTISPECIES: beta-ketoacyl-ACP synthase III [Clostridium]|uniref:Beta-ketoacyl-[acyl-carrier-protein] synthase III n=3 Tax=Clostridium TaxID=1485 RepID=D8GJE0_CLOLD|nr:MULTISPECIES: beta-ketoacyl-ACP synthase III [Clostridium]ADK17228.1 3-oxoacyl-(acyl-carrier-protein) synthase III [Clostridium ljungdahlii DSM 13528]AGY76269.1 ketoacyl-ACP synthase III [Clostridium autoethanogenum DSM 10061]ALU36429.1 3-oxoacyl-(acyl-carrier-protein) synthase 3 [Clostridium autoethanogenum DSM 10061]OAA84595.1 3-oxoacyl-[acyl-carrier-protein] synthase 3 [Clostridium ljungdahlii DSM 13528]OVY48999.1 3-oxoacyl-[acyl-carrier-protein] synthase 3 [Clostridium autoethanogenum]
MNKVEITGTGSYVPPKIVDNNDLSLIVDTSDEWITSRTGIKERRISQGEDTSDMATKAAIEAIKDAKISVEDIELIVLATVTPDSFMPSTACIVQKNIKAVNATCFDVSAACSGFAYAMDIAVQFIRAGRFKNVLVIGADTFSKILDWKDRSTCILFGDGASAAFLQSGEEDQILSTYTGSDGNKGDSLTCPAVAVNNPYVDGVISPIKSVVGMEGREIFKFGVKVLEKSVKALLQQANCTLEEIKYIIPHQANYRIIECAAKKLGIGMDRFYINLDAYGNTSAASIGIALDEVRKKNLVKKGDKILIVGFGGGLTYGGFILKINS